ncbi:hypothetical protein Hanom_Chr10g00939911 [Helianthus anomalus]
MTPVLPPMRVGDAALGQFTSRARTGSGSDLNQSQKSKLKFDLVRLKLKNQFKHILNKFNLMQHNFESKTLGTSIKPAVPGLRSSTLI